jgi:serine/threonine protein kinase/WD40 repeat protein
MSEAHANTERIFWAAQVLASPDERASYLDRACGHDAALRAQVEELLAAYPRAEGFLEQPVAQRPTEPPPNGHNPSPASEERPGTRIGPYKLLERIGEGGMGTVWMAEQTDPVQRTVAFKIVKAGMDTRQVVARFEAERQALALMDHPNIATVLDGGATTAGRPYFVMELVKGVPITRYCDAHRLTPHERLELFAPVCHAIQHAHQKGIIHRDIKPANVLVAPYDGRPVPKVIDFGVAKAVGQRLTERTLFTGFGAVLGTLEYMSPEQAELNNQDIDTRSDIYALGVLLYELLTGTTPLSRERLTQGAFTETLRLIREEEPPRPSARLSESREALPSIAAQRHMEPARLTKLVRGELDWIVMKALEKDRNRRYETASSLATDVEHYLADEPVVACPPTVAYRLHRFARRNKGPMAAVSLVVLSLVAGIIGTTWNNVHIRQALAARDEALSDLQAQQEQTRAAEREKTLQLASALSNEARLSRQARQPGRRYRSLEAIAQAVDGLRSLDQLERHRLDLRNDALASLTLWDVRPVKRFPASAMYWADPLGEHYPLADAPNVVTWRRLADDQVVRRWQWEGSPCFFLDVSPDSRYVLAICREDRDRGDGICRVWESSTGRVALEHPISETCGHAFRPHSQVLALAQTDGSIALCDLLTAGETQAVPPGPLPGGLCFHPDGQYLAVSFPGRADTVVWDLAGGKVVLRLPGERYGGGNLAWSPDGSLLAIGGIDTYISLFTFPGGDPQAVFRGHEHVVTGLKFHPSGRMLASGSHDGTTRLWSLAPGGELVLPGESPFLGFSRDGRRLVTHSGKAATEWELADPGDIVHYFPNGGGPTPGPWSVSFSPKGALLASASQRGVLLWDAATALPVGRLPSGDGYALAFHPEERSLFTTGNGGVREWPIVRERNGRTLRIGPPTVLRTAASGGRSPQIAVAGTGESIFVGEGDGGVYLVPLTEPGATRRLGQHDRVFEVALSPDGRWAASAGGWGDAVCVWDVSRGTLVRRLDHQGEYAGVRFSPDGCWLVSGVRNDFCFWEVGSWERKFRLPRDPRSLFSSLAFTRDGRLLAVVDGRNRIHLHDAACLPPRHLATLETPEGPASLTGLSLSPDGTRLAATMDYNNTTVLWNLRQLRQELAALDLDWEMPPYPPAERAAESEQPLTVNVILSPE